MSATSNLAAAPSCSASSRAVGADERPQGAVDAPPGLEALWEPQPGRQLEHDEPVRAGGFDQPLYVVARESPARQVLEDEVGDDEVEWAGGRGVPVHEAELG